MPESMSKKAYQRCTQEFKDKAQGRQPASRLRTTF